MDTLISETIRQDSETRLQDADLFTTSNVVARAVD